MLEKTMDFETALNKNLYTILGISNSEKYVISIRKSSGKDFFQIWKKRNLGSFVHHDIICGDFDTNGINKIWLEEYKRN